MVPLLHVLCVFQIWMWRCRFLTATEQENNQQSIFIRVCFNENRLPLKIHWTIIIYKLHRIAACFKNPGYVVVVIVFFAFFLSHCMWCQAVCNLVGNPRKLVMSLKKMVRRGLSSNDRSFFSTSSGELVVIDPFFRHLKKRLTAQRKVIWIEDVFKGTQSLHRVMALHTLNHLKWGLKYLKWGWGCKGDNRYGTNCDLFCIFFFWLALLSCSLGVRGHQLAGKSPN